MAVESESVAYPLLPHQGKASRIDETERMIGIAMQQIVSLPFQSLSNKEPL